MHGSLVYCWITGNECACRDEAGEWGFEALNCQVFYFIFPSYSPCWLEFLSPEPFWSRKGYLVTYSLVALPWLFQVVVFSAFMSFFLPHLFIVQKSVEKSYPLIIPSHIFYCFAFKNLFIIHLSEVSERLEKSFP